MKDGVRHRVSTGTKDAKSARIFVERMNVAIKMPSLEKAIEILRMYWGEDQKTALPLASAWDRYLELAKATGRDNVSERTIRDRRLAVSRLVSWIGGNRPSVEYVSQVDGSVAASFAASLKDMGLKSKTRSNVLQNLGSVWAMLEKVSPDIRSPWANLSPRDDDSERFEAFTREQETAIMAAARRIGRGWDVACMVARHTGLRYGDVATLEWSEINLEEGVIRLDPNKTVRHGITVVVPIAPPLRAVLESYPKATRYVLPLHAKYYGKRGKKIQEIINFRSVLDSAGVVGNYTFHSWRATFRTRLSEAGADIETAMLLMGHTTREMSRHYDHDEHLPELRRAVLGAMK